MTKRYQCEDTFMKLFVCLGLLKATDGDFAQCGKRFTSTTEIPSRRIVGGRVCTPCSWPWQVALLLNTAQVCGGSLVSPQWIVTAAHCFDQDNDPTHWTAVLGVHRLTNKTMEEEQMFAIKTILVHPQFRSNVPKYDRPSDYDIAIIKLDSTVELNNSTHPVCLLPSNATMAAGKECYVTGWGRTQMAGPQSCSLREAKVRLISNESCNNVSSYNGTIHGRALCAGTQEGGTGPCQFDSGGPLACEYDGRWYLAGIVSWGHGCGMPNKYGVYSNMFELSSWAKDIVWANVT